MNGIVSSLMFVAAGAMAGLASAVAAIEYSNTSRRDSESPWQSWEIAPGSADPYALDHYMLAGRFPPAAGQLRELSTQRTSDGKTLNAACEYVLTANTAPNSWWSLAAYSGRGASPAAGAVLSSDMAIQESDGSLRLTVSRIPASGNWLRPPSAGGFTLIYTTAQISPGRTESAEPVFTVEQARC